jgi:hypothetical protein
VRNKNNETIIIPEHHSPVRHILNETKGVPNDIFIDSFENARDFPSAYVIMEGDWGGQIYFSCPMQLVKCSEESLHNLLDDLDVIAWECNEGDGKGLYYEIHSPGDGIGGGMGGGEVKEELWIHNEFMELKLFDEIEQVILGKKDRIRKQMV